MSADHRPVEHASGVGALASARFAAVIFDMDGTLVDSTAAVERSWAAWAGDYGLTREDMEASHGVPSAAIIERLIPAEQRQQAKQHIDELELADLDGVIPLPGAVEALTALDDSRRAIATSCTTPLMEARVATSGIPRPGVIVTADHVERGKPAPDPFLLAAERLGVDPARCLVVEDAISGLTGAKAAGCATLAVVTTTPRAVLEGSGLADAVVGLLDEVRFVLTDTGIAVEDRSPA